MSTSVNSTTPGIRESLLTTRPERDMDKIAKGWKIAMAYSRDRLKRVHDWKDDELERAVREGRLVLETVCLFVHACIKHGQYQCVFASCCLPSGTSLTLV